MKTDTFTTKTNQNGKVLSERFDFVQPLFFSTNQTSIFLLFRYFLPLTTTHQELEGKNQENLIEGRN